MINPSHVQQKRQVDYLLILIKIRIFLFMGDTPDFLFFRVGGLADNIEI